MNAFASAVKAPRVRHTTNGMKALDKTGSALVDLFGAVGAMRGQNIVPTFVKAYAEDRDLALRIMLWARDARGGAGERQLFRDVLTHLETNNPEDARRLMARTPEIGRWDDLLVFKDPALFNAAVHMIKDALLAGNGLAAKWMPRKGALAARLRGHLGMSPKQYRKTLVNLTKVVETQMCAGEWEAINLEHVPSLATARYKRAFNKRMPQKFKKFTKAVVAGEAKINTGAVFPHDIIKELVGSYRTLSAAELDHVRGQWAALPNYMGDGNILPVVDVSGSMSCSAGDGKGSLTCMQVAISLGLYCADKNKGAFNRLFATFSSSPTLERLKGDIVAKVQQMVRSNWDMSTDLNKVMELILKTATSKKVPQEDMPKMLLIMSDMQFNACARFDDSAMEMIRRKFETAGYTAPQIVFWNIRDYGNKPVEANEHGVALVSGFSPAILKSVLAADLKDFTPYGIMMKTIMIDRYNV
jgi:hypothetical protein